MRLMGEQLNEFHGQEERLREKDEQVAELELQLTTNAEEIGLMREQLNEFQGQRKLIREKDELVAELE